MVVVEGEPNSQTVEIKLPPQKLVSLQSYLDILDNDRKMASRGVKGPFRDGALEYIRKYVDPEIDFAEYAQSLSQIVQGLHDALEQGETITLIPTGENGEQEVIIVSSESIKDYLTRVELNSLTHVVFPINLNTPNDDPDRMAIEKLDGTLREGKQVRLSVKPS